MGFFTAFEWFLLVVCGFERCLVVLMVYNGFKSGRKKQHLFWEGQKEV